MAMSPTNINNMMMNLVVEAKEEDSQASSPNKDDMGIEILSNGPNTFKQKSFVSRNQLMGSHVGS